MASIELSACGFALTLTPEGEVPTDRFYGRLFHGRVALTSPVAPTFQRSVAFPLSDLTRLVVWVEAHITRLIEEPPQSLESYSWVPLDLSLSVRCLSGGGSRNEEGIEGSFGLQVSVAVGEDPASGLTVYAGLTGEVVIEDALAFCQQVTTYVGGVGY